MKHFLLKFNHGVEIGAYNAYLGHFKRTGQAAIHKILQDELEHRQNLKTILAWYGEKPNQTIDTAFEFIGKLVAAFCVICPIWSLDLVARTMELFAVFNYRTLAKMYPYFSGHFIEMAETEERHNEFFKGGQLWLNPKYEKRK